jgi:outer membrane receptor for ferrienterochelin and colicins
MNTLPSRSRQRPFVIFAVLALLAVGTSTVAQEASTDLSEASLEQLGTINVSSASKHLQDAGEAPSSVTVVTADEIQKHGCRTLADILRTIRGFYVTYDRNYSYLGFRGFGLPGDYNTRILLLVDGHRINDNIYDQAMIGTEFPVDVDLIERVEVIRGPSSSLYGSNAFFAVINVVTRKAPDINGWEFSFAPGSFDTYKGRATYGREYRGMDILLSGSFYDSAGQALFFPEFNDPNSKYGIARNDHDRYDDLLLTVTFRKFTFQAIDGVREKGIPTAPYETEFADSRTHSIDQHQSLDLSYKTTVRRWEVDARSYFDRYGYDGYWPFAGTGLNVDYARGQRLGGELQLSRSLLHRHLLTAGTEFRDNLQQDQKNYDVAGTIYVNDRRKSWMSAGFVQDEFSILPQLILNAGVRYDAYERYGGHASPRLALIYHPVGNARLKLLYGTAFRVPNVYEAYYGSSGAGNDTYIRNPFLKPEYISTVEGVWEQSFARHFHASTNVFRSYLNDLISLEQDPESGKFIFRNAARARSTGLAVELGGNHPSGLEGSLSYSFIETENQKTSQLLVNSPRHLVKLNLTAPFYRRRLFASGDAQYVDTRQTLAGNRLPGFPVFNATLFGHALRNRLDVSASVYNLLDRHYFDVGPEEDRQDALLQDGRSLRLKLTWHFGGKQ